MHINNKNQYPKDSSLYFSYKIKNNSFSINKYLCSEKSCFIENSYPNHENWDK